MINQILTYGIVIPFTFILFNLALFWVLTKAKTRLAEGLKEITKDWVEFMGRGIPIPTEIKDFEGKPTLIGTEFSATKITRVLG
jgi:hypothetical protein